MSFKPVEGDWFRSKERQRSKSSCCRVCAVPDKPERGLLSRNLLSNGGARSSREQGSREAGPGCAAHLPRCSISAHGLPLPPSWIAVLCAAPLHAPQSWGVRHYSHFTLRILVWRAGFQASAHDPLWASKARLCTEEKKKKNSRLCHPDSVFISRDLLMALLVTMGSNPHRYSDPETSRALKRVPPLPNPREKINFPKAGLHHLFWAELCGRFSPLPATCYALWPSEMTPGVWRVRQGETQPQSSESWLPRVNLQGVGPVLGTPARTPLGAFPTLEPAFSGH